jgi:hypothetical protein
MGTAIFGALGTAVAGPVGGFVGAGLGSLFDSYVLLPLLTPTPPDQENRAQDTPVQRLNSQEGANSRTLYGEPGKIAGTLIYRSKRRKVEVVEEFEAGGGKKGGGGKGGGQKVTQTTFEYYHTLAVSLGRASGPDATVQKVWADTELIYDRGGQEDSRYESITFYNGEQTAADPSILQMKTRDGVDTITPSYRGCSYLVIKELLLSTEMPWGARIPNIRVLLRTGTFLEGTTVQKALEGQLRLAGWSPSQYDLDSVPGCVRGARFETPLPTRGSVIAIMRSYGLDVAMRDNILTFYSRASADTFAVKRDHFIARPSDRSGLSSGAFPYQRRNLNPQRLPGSTVVNHIDPLRNFENGSQSWQDRSGIGRNTQTNNLTDMVFTSEEATAIARKDLNTAFVERSEIEGVLHPRYYFVRTGDILQLPKYEDGGEVIFVRVTQSSLRGDGAVEFVGVITNANLIAQASVQDDVPFVDPPPYSPPVLTTTVVDLPITSEVDPDVPRQYAFTRRANTGSGRFIGSVLYQAPSETSTYAAVGATGNESAVGETTSVLGSLKADGATPVSPSGSFDNTNTVTVTMQPGSRMATKTDQEVFDGANLFLVGSEMLAAAVVTDNGNNSYTLSRLIRGLNGTTVSGHTIGEGVVLLNLGTSVVVDHSLSSLGMTKFFKMAPTSAVLSNITAFSSDVEGNSVRARAPHFRDATWSGSSSLTVRWFAGTRLAYDDWLQSIPQKSDEDKWRVEVWNGSAWIFDSNVTSESVTISSPPLSAGSQQVRVFPWSDVLEAYETDTYMEVTV